jgi:histone acetyltransferase
LETIERRLESQKYYITKDIFIADLSRMCINCKNYNNADTQYFKCAVAIETEFVKKPPVPDSHLPPETKA